MKRNFFSFAGKRPLNFFRNNNNNNNIHYINTNDVDDEYYDDDDDDDDNIISSKTRKILCTPNQLGYDPLTDFVPTINLALISDDLEIINIFEKYFNEPLKLPNSDKNLKLPKICLMQKIYYPTNSTSDSVKSKSNIKYPEIEQQLVMVVLVYFNYSFPPFLGDYLIDTLKSGISIVFFYPQMKGMQEAKVCLGEKIEQEFPFLRM
jgi:hypothetical protein